MEKEVIKTKLMEFISYAIIFVIIYKFCFKVKR